MRHAALALALLGGCAKSVPVMERYRLDYVAPAAEVAPLPAIVRVELFDVAAPIHREAIAWGEGTYEMGTHAAHRWMATPPRMVTELLARDLAASGAYEAVLQGLASVVPDYELSGYVERFEEDVASPGCSAVMEVRVLLVRLDDGRPLFQRRYGGTRPCEGEGPAGFVAAMSDVMRGISAQVRHDVHEAVAADRAGPPGVAGR